jgi:hypothetical protein
VSPAATSYGGRPTETHPLKEHLMSDNFYFQETSFEFETRTLLGTSTMAPETSAKR